ncbi:glycyl-radical enzyme activating protein [Enterococcus sp.]|uniref:glycyl-radical enzyme activating protein n=1 Tax=Enterococcus sp. TaxID=35783 RepID=UPI00291598AE|nr:glycyl-radical enzyme activating protein [Enterococcus sp.]MDU5336531.1 glycyl-radical enzyme activating protein [Enterococcus sp.]
MSDAMGCIFNIQRFSIHDGPGIRTTIFFKGCPLRCTWCSNPESQKRQPEPIWDNQKKKDILAGQYYTIEEVMNIIRKDVDYYQESNGGITVTGGEVLAQKNFVIDLLKECKKESIHTACETSAYSSSKDFKELMDHVDLLIMDIKHYDTLKHKKKTAVALEPILKNLEQAIQSNQQMLLRIPIIPGYNDSLNDAVSFGRLLNAYHVKKVELLPFHQFGKSKYRFLKRTYEFEGVPQLTSTDLIPYAETIGQFGINCVIG